MHKQLLHLVFLLASSSMAANAASPSQTTWWPDANTGLMWTAERATTSLNWEQANAYCNALTVGTFSGWRLPSRDEFNAISTYPSFLGADHLPGRGDQSLAGDRNTSDRDSELVLKGGIQDAGELALWTSTKASDTKAWTVLPGNPPEDTELDPRPSDNYWQRAAALGTKYSHSAICTRRMEPELLQIAKSARVHVPVHDVQTLKAYVVLSKARTAYQAGRYQDAVAQGQNALTLDAALAPAEWAIGISYGRLQQWDQAVASLEAAQRIDSKYRPAKAALQWALEEQKAAKTGKVAKAKPPVWN